MNTPNLPLISIGMPIYNGEKWLEQTLNSLLRQNYKNYEILICDNGSHDRTREIASSYSKNFSQVNYYRVEENRGVNANFLLALALSSGKYFMWAGADDLWEPNYLSTLGKLLEENPSAVLAISGTLPIDTSNNIINKFFHPLPDSTVGMTPSERIIYVIRYIYGHMLYGLHKTSTLLEAVKLIESWQVPLAGDVMLVLRILCDGDLVVAKKNLFYYRMGGGMTSKPHNSIESLMENHGEIAKKIFEIVPWNSFNPEEIFKIQDEILSYLHRWFNSNYKHSIVNSLYLEKITD